MPTYKLPVSWGMCGTMYVDADSRAEAEKIAREDKELPLDGEYLSGSFQIDSNFDDYGEVVDSVAA